MSRVGDRAERCVPATRLTCLLLRLSSRVATSDISSVVLDIQTLTSNLRLGYGFRWAVSSAFRQLFRSLAFPSTSVSFIGNAPQRLGDCAGAARPHRLVSGPLDGHSHTLRDGPRRLPARPPPLAQCEDEIEGRPAMHTNSTRVLSRRPCAPTSPSRSAPVST